MERNEAYPSELSTRSTFVHHENTSSLKFILLTHIVLYLVGKPEGKRPLGKPRRRWVDNIRTDLQEVGCGYMDWIGLDQD